MLNFEAIRQKGTLARSMMLAVGAWMGLAASAYSADYTIGISIWDVSNNPSSVPIIAGMNEAAKAAGVKIDVSDPKWDASAQVDNIRDFVTRRVDAIAVFPIDVVGDPARGSRGGKGGPARDRRARQDRGNTLRWRR